jgi:hypothetical protein
VVPCGRFAGSPSAVRRPVSPAAAGAHPAYIIACRAGRVERIRHRASRPLRLRPPAGPLPTVPARPGTHYPQGASDARRRVRRPHLAVTPGGEIPRRSARLPDVLDHPRPCPRGRLPAGGGGDDHPDASKGDRELRGEGSPQAGQVLRPGEPVHRPLRRPRDHPDRPRRRGDRSLPGGALRDRPGELGGREPAPPPDGVRVPVRPLHRFVPQERGLRRRSAGRAVPAPGLAPRVARFGPDPRGTRPEGRGPGAHPSRALLRGLRPRPELQGRVRGARHVAPRAGRGGGGAGTGRRHVRRDIQASRRVRLQLRGVSLRRGARAGDRHARDHPRARPGQREPVRPAREAADHGWRVGPRDRAPWPPTCRRTRLEPPRSRSSAISASRSASVPGGIRSARTSAGARRT